MLSVLQVLIVSIVALGDSVAHGSRASRTAQSDPTIVMTEYGPIQGTLHGSVVSFQSVPFGKPPIDDLRWTMPQAPDAWTETLQCNKDPPKCLQPTNNKKTRSEDCLYLNVFVPLSCLTKETEKCSSLTWIHGGSFFTGYAGGESFNGTYMSELTGIIVVSINYRLGAIGFLWNDELSLYGNYGYMDQVFAMEWVYNNIDNFGGDSNQIYIYGESAGATSVGLHIMNTSNPFLTGAIMESNPAGIPLRTNKTWGDMPLQFENLMGCSKDKYPDATDRLACLRSVKDEDQIMAAQDEAIVVETAVHPWLFWPDFMPWTPTVNGGDGLIMKQPVYAFQAGEILDIPIISGTNQNESDIIYDPIPTECWEVSVELDDLFGPEKATKIRDMYNIPEGWIDCRAISKPFETDCIFRCPSRNMTLSASKYTKNNKDKIYWYHFNHVPSFGSDPHCMQPNGGVCHTAEIPFVFGSTIAANFTKDELILSEMMRWYWASFAMANGDVNKYSSQLSENELYIEWMPFIANGNQSTMMLNIEQLNVDSPFANEEKYCDFWDSLGYDWLKRP